MRKTETANRPFKFAYPRNVRFRCNLCALCCGDTEKRKRKILMLKTEASQISQKTTLKIEEFAEKTEGSEPYIYQMRKTINGKCIFLKDNLCTIYSHRPLICRFYPFELKNEGHNQYAFAYATECPTIGKGRVLKKEFYEKLFKKLETTLKENVKIT